MDRIKFLIFSEPKTPGNFTDIELMIFSMESVNDRIGLLYWLRFWINIFIMYFYISTDGA